MKLYHVVAMAKNRVIGKDNKLPWHFPEDLKFFKQLTTGNTIIMGRKTYESIGRPLSNRTNFVLSRTAKNYPGAQTFHSLDEAVRSAKTKKVFIIGGAELYKQTIEKVDGIYLTRIGIDFEDNAHYPEIPDSFAEIEIHGLREADPKIEVVYYEKLEVES